MVKWIDLSEAIYGGYLLVQISSSLLQMLQLSVLFWFSSCTFRGKLMLSGEIQCMCVGRLRAE